MQKRQYGFTLIEILIAVAIVGILAAIAVPQYGSYLRDSRRTDAHVALRSAAQSLERCRSQNFTFAHTSCVVKPNSDQGYYTIAASGLSRTAYILTATPVGTKSQANDTDCATLTLNAQGDTGSTPGTGDCW